VFVLVESSRGEVLLHRRSDLKDLWPGRWDLAVGGVVASGEDYDEAAAREVGEELGLVGVAPERLGSGRYEDADVRLLAGIYRLVHDGPFHFTDGEVIEAEFAGLADLELHLRQDPFVPDSVALVLPWIGLTGRG
jgi:8-oxo-dGTP pyrophosphatase MutT (NUDIX family)